MRVAYLLRYFPTISETFVYREIDGVMAAGTDVMLAHLGSRPDGRYQDEPPAVRAWAVPRPRMPRWVGGQSTTAGSRWLADHQRPRDVLRLTPLARWVKPFDHVHVHFAGEAAEFAHALHLDLGLPYSVTIHANDLYRPRPSLQDVLGAASAVVVVSHHQSGMLSRLGIEAQVVRCGPDLARWSTDGELPGPGLRALCVARDVPKKGLGLLLEAWSSVVDDLDGASLTLVSDLDASALPVGVQCTGLLPPGRVREAMGASNLFVLPCVRAPDGDMDGVPVVLMEALAAGRPVLTTDLGALPELVDHRVGWTVPSGDTGALAGALVEIAGAGQERGVRGSRGPGRLRERGFHLAAQVAGVREAWRR